MIYENQGLTKIKGFQKSVFWGPFFSTRSSARKFVGFKQQIEHEKPSKKKQKI